MVSLTIFNIMKETEIIALLAQHGIKPTANRIILVKELHEEERPQSLMELEERILTIDKGNIYRMLTLFREHHLVHAIECNDSGTKYELCHSSHGEDDDDDIHAHFYCERCHELTCLEDTHIPQIPLPEGYRKTSVTYTVKGICEQCSRKERSS